MFENCTGTNATPSTPVDFKTIVTMAKEIYDKIPRATMAKILCSAHACQQPKFLRWKKSHRRSRINKKWHKKYGYECEY